MEWFLLGGAEFPQLMWCPQNAVVLGVLWGAWGIGGCWVLHVTPACECEVEPVRWSLCILVPR